MVDRLVWPLVGLVALVALVSGQRQSLDLMEGGQVVLEWHWSEGRLHFTLVSLQQADRAQQRF